MATSSIAARLGFGPRARKTAEQKALDEVASKQAVDKKQLAFDLFTQLSYMASLATAKASRDVMFMRAASLNLASSPYFVQINTLVHRLKYDYSEACRSIADRVSEPDVAALLLRMSGSLSSGEDEAEFLNREAAVMAELYEAQYEADIESLRKWSDAYAALIVSAGLVVVVSIISMMIYTLGAGMILLTGMLTVGVTSVGTWVLHISAPKESFTRKAGLSSDLQLKALAWFRVTAPIGFIGGAVAWAAGGGLGWFMMIAGASLIPPGFLMWRDMGRLRKLDADIATSTRMLGGITSAIGTTIRDALTKVDRRSLGSLEPYYRKLQVRMSAGIAPERCWKRFVTESGSELIERTVNIFWDALTIGGEPGETGRNAAFFSSKISILRQKRELVAATFGYLVLPLHAAMTGLLVFIVKVMSLFAESLVQQAPDPNATGAPIPDLAGVGGFNTFASVNFDFLNLLVAAVIVVFTLANALAPWGASGGHRLRMVLNLGMMMVISGVMLTVIPPIADAIFEVITAPAA
ncbi:MAG: hypothetical protein WD208_00655 [Dehalococcoidia bacterium]